MTPAAFYSFNAEREFKAAEAWFQEHSKEAVAVRTGGWQTLLDRAHSAGSCKDLLEDLDRYLHRADHREGGNRWPHPHLTVSLMDALAEAAGARRIPIVDENGLSVLSSPPADYEFAPPALPSATEAHLDQLGSAGERIHDLWRRERALRLLSAIVCWRKMQASGT